MTLQVFDALLLGVVEPDLSDGQHAVRERLQEGVGVVLGVRILLTIAVRAQVEAEEDAEELVVARHQEFDLDGLVVLVPGIREGVAALNALQRVVMPSVVETLFPRNAIVPSPARRTRGRASA
eukprot:tig00020611_g12109.t1